MISFVELSKEGPIYRCVMPSIPGGPNARFTPPKPPSGPEQPSSQRFVNCSLQNHAHSAWRQRGCRPNRATAVVMGRERVSTRYFLRFASAPHFLLPRACAPERPVCAARRCSRCRGNRRPLRSGRSTRCVGCAVGRWCWHCSQLWLFGCGGGEGVGAQEGSVELGVGSDGGDVTV